MTARARLAALACLALPVVALGGCSEDPSQERKGSGGSGGGSIRVQVSGEPEETKVYESVAAAFEKANEGTKVQVVAVPSKGDHLARLTTSFASGNPPDVFLVNFREYTQFVARGSVDAVGPRLEDAGVDLGEYYEQPVEAFTYRDQLQCMPQNISSLVVYYNRAVFAAAGVPEPAAGWSWQDFVSTAGRLTDGDVRGVGIDPSLVRLAPFVWSAGGDVVDDLDAPTRLTLDEAKAKGALQGIVDLVRSGAVPTEEEIAAQDLQTRFVTGKLGMLLSSRREVPALREVGGLDFDVAALPVVGEAATILHSDAYCISKGAEDADLATEFITFATGRQGQTLAALGGRTVPSLKSVAGSPAFLSPGQAPENSQVFLDGIPTIRRTPIIPQWPEIEDVTEEQMTRAFYEKGTSLDEALAELDRRTRPIFARDQ